MSEKVTIQCTPGEGDHAGITSMAVSITREPRTHNHESRNLYELEFQRDDGKVNVVLTVELAQLLVNALTVFGRGATWERTP